jgi:CHAD domain-containing protein
MNWFSPRLCLVHPLGREYVENVQPSEPPQLPQTIGALAIEVLGRNAAAFEEHMPGARDGEDPLHVHQMRVATRRMRAALRLFSDVLPPQTSSLNDELNWIAGQLGATRDLDVQVRRLRETAAELGLSEALVPYGAWLEDQRQRAHAELVSALEMPRFAQLMQSLHQLNEWTPNPQLDAPLCDDAPGRLRRAHRQLRKRARRIDEHAPATELHQVRIRAKRLRYAAEFFEVAYGKPAARLAGLLVTLQDRLGDLQDGVVSGERIHQAVQTEAAAWPAETSLALGRLVQRDVHHARVIRKEFARLYRAVRDEGWRRLRRSLK